MTQIINEPHFRIALFRIAPPFIPPLNIGQKVTTFQPILQRNVTFRLGQSYSWTSHPIISKKYIDRVNWIHQSMYFIQQWSDLIFGSLEPNILLQFSFWGIMYLISNHFYWHLRSKKWSIIFFLFNLSINSKIVILINFAAKWLEIWFITKLKRPLMDQFMRKKHIERE